MIVIFYASSQFVIPYANCVFFLCLFVLPKSFSFVFEPDFLFKLARTGSMLLCIFPVLSKWAVHL